MALDDGARGFKTLGDIGPDHDLAEMDSQLNLWRLRSKRKPAMPWWYYQCRNRRKMQQARHRWEHGGSSALSLKIELDRKRLKP